MNDAKPYEVKLIPINTDKAKIKKYKLKRKKNKNKFKRIL